MKKAATVLAALLFAVALFRAWTQSITYDEAITWRLYVVTPISSMLRTYDANHHILHTWLVRIITSILGVSDFTMRIAALAGTALYLWTLVRIGVLLFGRTWLAPAAVLLLGASPLVMDFEVAARGYGLALGLFFAGLERLLHALRNSASKRDLWIAGAALGLSIAANLTFLVPCGIALLLFLRLWSPPVLAEESPKKRRHHPSPAGPKSSDLLLAFGAAIFLLFLIAPVKHMMKPGLFYVGQPTLAASLEDLADCTLGHNEGIFDLNKPVDGSQTAKRVFGWGVYPAVLLIGLALGFRQRSGAGIPFQPLLYVAILATGSWLAVILISVAGGLPYPTDRTGLYHVPLFALVLLLIASSAPAAFRIGASVLAAALAVSFVLQFQTNYFRMWRFDAETRSLVREFNQQGASRGRPVVVGISSLLQPAVVFYQTTLALESFDYAVHEEMRPGLDAYLLTGEDYGLIEKYQLRTVRALEVPQILMAVPAARP